MIIITTFRFQVIENDALKEGFYTVDRMISNKIELFWQSGAFHTV